MNFNNNMACSDITVRVSDHVSNRTDRVGYEVNPYLLYSSLLIFPSQIIDIYNQSAFIFAYHVTNFAMIYSLVLLKEKRSQLTKF